MLAQSFQPATDLGISEAQKEALMKTLVLLETGKLAHAKITRPSAAAYREGGEFTGHFNMGRWQSQEDCGTVCCIAGTAELVGGVEFPTEEYGDNFALKNLFWVGGFFGGDISHITPGQAARALRSYLTTGDANWAEAVA